MGHWIDKMANPHTTWIVFGRHPDGTVDISDGNRDIAARIPAATAEAICDAHNAVVSAIVAEVVRRSTEVPR